MLSKIGQNIKSLIVFIVLAALAIAVLSQFNYDIIEFVVWCWKHIVDWVIRLAGYFVSLPVFRAFFKA